MPVTVEEAIAVLRDHASSRRAQAALSTLEEDVKESARREPDTDNASGKPPSFPTKETLAERLKQPGEAHINGARGGHSPDDGPGAPATARKGT